MPLILPEVRRARTAEPQESLEKTGYDEPRDMNQSFATSAGGPWTVRHEPSRNVLHSGPTVWTMIAEHRSGWKIVHEEFATRAVIYAPGGEIVGSIQERRHNPSSHRLIAALTLWVDENAASLGLSGLD